MSEAADREAFHTCPSSRLQPHHSTATATTHLILPSTRSLRNTIQKRLLLRNPARRESEYPAVICGRPRWRILANHRYLPDRHGRRWLVPSIHITGNSQAVSADRQANRTVQVDLALPQRPPYIQLKSTSSVAGRPRSGRAGSSDGSRPALHMCRKIIRSVVRHIRNS
jgi:hypothetical protein